MIVLRYIGYVIACQWLVVRMVVYYVHSVLVFFTKPGARLVIPLVLLGIVLWSREPIRQFAGEPIDAVWNGAVRAFTPSDLYQLATPYRTEIATAFGLLILFIGISILSSMLRPIVGTFSAPRRPIPPQPPFYAPDTKVRTVRARIATPKRGRDRFKGELSQLMGRLPAHLDNLTRQTPREMAVQPRSSSRGWADLPTYPDSSESSSHAPEAKEPRSAPPSRPAARGKTMQEPAPVAAPEGKPVRKRHRKRLPTERAEQDRVAREQGASVSSKQKRKAVPKTQAERGEKRPARPVRSQDRARAERVAALRRNQQNRER